MQILSPPKQKILDTIQGYFKRANLHPAAVALRDKIRTNYGYFEGGNKQWDPYDLEVIRERGQKPLSINIIKSRINNLSGVEIQSRFRTAVINSSGNIDHDKLANALTNWNYFVQEDQQIPHKGSLKYRDMLICGIGWSNSYQENGYFYYDHVHPYNVIPDFDDLSPQFDSMKFVCRKRWMDPAIIRKTWPKVAAYIDFSDPALFTTVYSQEITDRQSSFTSYNGYNGYSQTRGMIGEVQYKQPKKAYFGMDSQGFHFETFDEEKAEEMANSPRDINEKESTQIMRGLFLNDFLLEAAPLTPNVPGLKDFSYIPIVLGREFETGVPYSLIDDMKDIQRDSNVRLTKAIYLANSTRLYIKGALPPDSTQKLEAQMKKADSVIILPPNCEFKDVSNDPLSQSQLSMLDKYDGLMQRTTGIQDDLMGRETNATSGVAQRQRQINSVRTHIFSFDNFASMKKRESKFMIGLLQGGDFENMLGQVVTEDQKETIILNLSRTIKGKKFVFNDIRTLPISLEIEEVPDYQNSREENKAMLENLFANPNAPLIMRSPTLMKIFGFRDYEKVSEEIKEAMMMQQQGEGAPQASGGQNPQESQSSEFMNQSLAYPGM